MIVKDERYFWHRLFRYVSIPIARKLVGTGTSPNQITLIGLACATVSALLFATGQHIYLVVAALFAQLSQLADLVDGDLARLTLKSSKYGEFLDGVVGKLESVFLLFGIAWGIYRFTNDVWTWVLGFLIISSMHVASIISVLASRTGLEQRSGSTELQGASEKALSGRRNFARILNLTVFSFNSFLMVHMITIAALMDQMFIFLLVGAVHGWMYVLARLFHVTIFSLRSANEDA